MKWQDKLTEDERVQLLVQKDRRDREREDYNLVYKRLKNRCEARLRADRAKQERAMYPMETAPRGDESITLHLPSGKSFRAYLVPVEGPDGTVWAWGEEQEGTAPADWSDGICWAENEDGVPSTQPIGWSE